MITPAAASLESEKLCRLAPVIPVLVIDDVAHAAPLAQALVKGGLPVLEVTLRTPCALEAIAEMAAVEGGVVGAGTLLSPADVKAAVDAGAKFGRLAGRHRQAARRLRRGRPAAAARCRERLGGDGPARARLHGAEVLPRRGLGRAPRR